MRQGTGERCDREVRRRRSVFDRLDDAGGQIGEGSKLPDVPLNLALDFGDLLEGAYAPLDKIVHPASRSRDGGQQCGAGNRVEALAARGFGALGNGNLWSAHCNSP